jgi:molybdate transport system substrate-binding protein
MAVLCIIAGLVVATSCLNPQKKQDQSLITLFAASGSRLVADEICQRFEQEQPCAVQINYASTGTLARQIEGGSEADLFISANKHWIDYLLGKNLLNKNSIRVLAGNRLVVIAPNKSPMPALDFDTVFDILSTINHHIAIGDPAYVPVGQYTKMVFDTLGWYEKIKDRIVKTRDVTAALHLVELGECDWGIVYKSEAMKSSKVKIMQEIPEHLHAPIRFYIAETGEQQKQKCKLAPYFLHQSVQNIYTKYGFTLRDILIYSGYAP